MTKKNPAPRGLSEKGNRLWNRVVEEYKLRPDELRTLEAACRASDLVDRMWAEGKTAELVTVGSMGQAVLHPIFPELRQQQAALVGLLKSLRLADVADEDGAAVGSPVGDSRSTAARAAAKAKWNKSYGAPA